MYQGGPPPAGYQGQPMQPGQYQQQPGYQQPGAPPAGYAPQPSAPAGYQQPGAPPAGQPGQYGATPTPNPIEGWFKSIDTDNSGHLDASELQRALAMGNLNYSLTDVDAMVRAFDQKNTRALNMMEFGKLHEFLTSVTASFAYYDKDRSKTLEVAEVSSALRQAGFNLDLPVLQAMMKKYDISNTGKLKLDEYIRMCLFLQSCVRTFGAFDSGKTGRITLDFNQFVYAASHI